MKITIHENANYGKYNSTFRTLQETFNAVNGGYSPDLKSLRYAVEDLQALMEHGHEWEYYDGWLGYESRTCAVCGVDINDLGGTEQ